MPTYVYTLQNDALAELTGSTNLVPTSSTATPQQVSVFFAAALSSGDKDVLDDYMLTRGYAFVGEDVPLVGACQIKFSGSLIAIALGLVTRFFADTDAFEGALAALNYECASPLRFSRLRVRVNANALASPTTVSLLRDGAATGMAVVVPAGATGVFSADGPEDYAAGQRYDLMAENTSGGLGLLIALSATVETTPI